MCYDEGRLLAYLDDEVAPAERAEIEAHVATCEECSANIASLTADRAVAARALGKLQRPAQVVELPKMRARRAARPVRRISWAQVAAVAAAALFIGSFAFAPVRTAAANLLHVFRVQKVQTVAISEADLKSIGEALKQGGHVDLKAFGEAWIDGTAARPKPVSLSEAQAAVDFPIKLASNQTSKPKLLLEREQSYRFKLNVSAINETLRSYGSERVLPASLDGKVFSVNVPPIVVAQYPLPKGTNTEGWPSKARGIYVGQARSPEIVVPEGVDAAELRDVLLNLPFLPQSVRDQLAAVDDWQSTLIIPNVDGSAHDVTIGGVSAVVVTPKSAARDARKKLGGPIVDSTTVIWNDQGVVRAVGGPIDEETAIELAKSTMR